MAKSNVKLNSLLDIEKEIQAKWEASKEFETDAPDSKSYVLVLLKTYMFS